MQISQGRSRVVIENVKPEIDCGKFPIKRTVGELVVVEADAFTDGHDIVAVELLYRRDEETAWRRAPMISLGQDRWRGEFEVTKLGRYQYSVRAWVDRYLTWRRDIQKRVEVTQDSHVDYLIGGQLLQAAVDRATGESAEALKQASHTLLGDSDRDAKIAVALDPHVLALMEEYPAREFATTYAKELPVVVDPERARFSSWYEFFPRSASPIPEAHGTLADCEARLEYVARMGFDVVYFPPIHPIGQAYRKGKNNSVTAEADDHGSPWAIGAETGGHKAIHPQLGTMDDFRRLVKKANGLGMQIALDIAYQCAPDHPYVKEHPEWFRARPDGTIQYAENPPKKYQDIYPFDFETENWQALWQELKSVIDFWIEAGVTIFRVDNPHTKAFPFWEWMIPAVKQQHPEAIFLAEAFTRPKVMLELAKLGFSQSYTYFSWRNTKYELTEYFTQLTKTDWHEVFRPNAWPNTPDILPEYLQHGGRAAFMARLILAATMSSNYGIYGPAFELGEHRAVKSGSEEYLDSEKYQLRSWDLERSDSLQELIARMNRIRRENLALQSNSHLEFHPTDNEQLICFSKRTADNSNIIMVVVNLDPYHKHTGWVQVPVELFGLEHEQSYQVHDLLYDSRYLWHGASNFVELDPGMTPAHVFRIRRRVRTEREFEYFM